MLKTRNVDVGDIDKNSMNVKNYHYCLDCGGCSH